jgi:hypothetical protein
MAAVLKTFQQWQQSSQHQPDSISETFLHASQVVTSSCKCGGFFGVITNRNINNNQAKQHKKKKKKNVIKIKS